MKIKILKTGLFFLVATVLWACSSKVKNPNIVHFVFVSDLHYGLTRTFNEKECTSAEVAGVMLEVINSLPGRNLPGDEGVGAGMVINGIEMIVNGGDVANRQEIGIQSAAISWRQFETGFIDKITTKTKAGEKTELFVIPGNHDVSNAIGFLRPMEPPTDASSMASIYNLMLRPQTPRTANSYNYATDRINMAIERFNICFFFINIWPGAVEREWIDGHLKQLPVGKPAIIFAHDQPDIEAKHLTNPTPPHDINAEAKYENMIPEMPASDGSSIEVQRDLVKFIDVHPAIKAYFHGNSNYSEFYVYTGPDNDICLHTFMVDSPMKGEYSSKDQSLLSFMVVSIDLTTMQMTARECFWARNDGIEWGESKTIALN